MTDINKLCDELEALRKVRDSYEPVTQPWLDIDEMYQSDLRNAAQLLIDAARKSVKLREELDGALATMMAAAIEIKDHWDAHCDDDGYGPVNLLRRLEKGFTNAGYALTAQGWIDLIAENSRSLNENATLRERIKKLEQKVRERGG